MRKVSDGIFSSRNPVSFIPSAFEREPLF
jgi:hypothetical protein